MLSVCALTAVMSANASATVQRGPDSAHFARPGRVLVGLGSRSLVRLNPTTFLPEGSRSELPDYSFGHVQSPGGGLIARGDENDGQLVIVGLADLRVVHAIRVAHRAQYMTPQVTPIAWPSTHVLIGYSQQFEVHQSWPGRVFIADPTQGKLIRSISVHGSVVDDARTPSGGAALLVSPTTHVGVSKLLLVSKHGRVSSTRLSKIRSGFVDGGEAPQSQALIPGLAIGRNRAFVVAAHEPVATIDLHTRRVSCHRVPHLMSGHLPTGPPETEGSAGALLELSRSLQLSGAHRLVVLGYEAHPARHADRIRYLSRTATVLDTRTWRVVHVFKGMADVWAIDHGFIGSFYGRRTTEEQPVHVRAFTSHFGLRYCLSLTGDRTWSVEAGRLFIGGLDFGSAAVERNLLTGRRVRSVPKGAHWNSPVFVWHRQ